MMKKKRLKLVFISILVGSLIAVFYSSCNQTDKSTGLIEAGSSFDYPLFCSIFSKYHDKNKVQINYQSIGSGGGVLQLTNKTIDFGASDAPLNNEQTEGMGAEVFLFNEVKDKLNDKGSFLSGGQQQRLCIAREIALKPEVILMDEPTSSLDPKSTAQIEDLMQSLKKNYTVIVVTHNMQQARRISDYSAFFFLGELVEYGPSNEVFQNPKDERTKNYIDGVFS